MMRDLVTVKEPRAPAMRCTEARDWLPILVGGQIGLTEWALVETHLSQCVECRQDEARLRRLVTRVGVARSSARDVVTDLIARLRPWPASARELTARTSARAIRGIGLGVTRFVTAVAHLRAALAIRRRSAGRAVANAIEALRRDIARTVAHAVRLCSVPAIRLRPSVRAAGTALALALALYALQRSYGARLHVRPPAAPGPGPVQIVPPRPASSVEPASIPRPPSLIDDQRQSRPRAVARSSARVPASGAARGEFLPPVPDHQPAVSVPHVVGRLSAKDRTAAERDFTALLTGVGGTELGRSRRDRFTAVQVVVPKSRYDDFAQGLARIGSWRPEAAFSPLPDAVHMTIRVSE